MRQRVVCSACGKTILARLEAHPGLIYHLCMATRHPLGAVRPMLTFEEQTTALQGFRPVSARGAAAAEDRHQIRGRFHLPSATR